MSEIEELRARVEKLEEYLAKAFDSLAETAENSAKSIEMTTKLALEIGILSQAVGYLGMAIVESKGRPITREMLADLLDSTLEGFSPEEMDEAGRTIHNLRLCWTGSA